MMKRFYSFLYIITDINNSSSPNWSNSRREKKRSFLMYGKKFPLFFLDAHNVGARDVNILHYYQQQMPLLYLSYLFSTR